MCVLVLDVGMLTHHHVHLPATSRVLQLVFEKPNRSSFAFTYCCEPLHDPFSLLQMLGQRVPAVVVGPGTAVGAAVVGRALAGRVWASCPPPPL